MRFKSYIQDEPILFPLNLDDLIPANDPVRVVSRVVDGVDLKNLEKDYCHTGRLAYHPKMLVKIIIYAYMRNIYSSRKIEDFTSNDVRFMWLSAMQRPDHNTINNFRSSKLKGTLREIFTQVVLLFAQEKMVTLKKCYTDGTKIEANANRYTFVWGKSIHTRSVKIAEQLNELWAYADSVCREEMEDRAPITYTDISSDKIASLVNDIDSKLKGKPVDPKIKSKLKRAGKSWREQLKRGEANAQAMGERNSMSKTDKEATFMRMKEDHMGNGQLKPAYNTQISSENGIITNYTIHQTPTDTTTYEQHTEEFNKMYGHYPDESIADAGYGSEENYEYAERNDIKAFIKYNYFHKEQSKRWKNDPFRSSNFYYNKQRDCYYCPMGQPMSRQYNIHRKTKTGFVQTITLYKAIRCIGCPLRGCCHDGKGERVIQVNHRLNELKAQARQLLTSDVGLQHRSQRPADVEQTFGNLKWNKQFKRFLLRGLQKVEIEFGLLSIAHNLSKLALKVC